MWFDTYSAFPEAFVALTCSVRSSFSSSTAPETPLLTSANLPLSDSRFSNAFPQISPSLFALHDSAEFRCRDREAYLFEGPQPLQGHVMQVKRGLLNEAGDMWRCFRFVEDRKGTCEGGVVHGCS